MLKFSVVIPTCNRPRYLERCLASLRREAGYDQSMDVIVVDDGSHTANALRVRTLCEYFGTKCAGDGRNHGMAVARNLGIAASQGEWIVFLDDDVTCDAGWFGELRNAVVSFTPDVVAFEGRVNPSGGGVWDREVQNFSGGACLTSHFGVRRMTVDQCGMFDPYFEYTGPYCEDHEFAVRLQRCGTIAFVASCSVTHAPREVPLLRYLFSAPERCRKLLLSDRYFYEKHPDGYRRFRYHPTFEATCRSYRFRHVVDVLRRRKVSVLLRHPFQTVILLLAALTEQISAWVLHRAITEVRFDNSAAQDKKELDAAMENTYTTRITTKTDR